MDRFTWKKEELNMRTTQKIIIPSLPFIVALFYNYKTQTLSFIVRTHTQDQKIINPARISKVKYSNIISKYELKPKST